jgi:hypothetical protein
MPIELGYQLFIHVCFGNYFGNIVLLIFLSFLDFFRMKHPDGVTGCPNDIPGCPDGGSSCPDDRVVSSELPCSLPWRACLCDLLCGTTSERHLSSVRMVNPVGLNRMLLSAAHHFSSSLCIFFVLCIFLMIFMSIFHVHVSSLQFISAPGRFAYLFTVLF